MKKLLIFLAVLLPVLATAQVTTFQPEDGSIYTKLKSNLLGRLQQETGYSMPLITSGKWSIGANIGYVQTYPDAWMDTSWTAGVSLGYRVTENYSVYTKTATNFKGDYTQETGLRTTLMKTNTYAVVGNAAWVMGLPFSSGDSPKWTAGLTLTMPLSKIFR